MRVLRVLGIIVIRGMRNLRVRITVVSLAKLSAAVILAGTFGSGRALVPVDVLAGPTIVPGDKGATITTTAGLPALKLSPSCRGVVVLVGEAGPHVLSRVGGFVLEIVLDGRAHLGPVFRRPVLAETAVLANLTVPDDRPSGGAGDWAVVYHEAARKELDELLHVAGLVQLGLPRRGHRAEVIGQGSDLRRGCRRPMLVSHKWWGTILGAERTKGCATAAHHRGVRAWGRGAVHAPPRGQTS